MKKEQIYNDGMKRNYATGYEYTGKNAATLDLFEDTFFMTFVQGKNLGFHLRKGSKGIALLLVEPRKTEKDGEEKKYFYKRGFTVFGLSCWEKDGAPVEEPDFETTFPWHKTPEEKPDRIAETDTPAEPETVAPEEKKDEVFKKLEEKIRPSDPAVNTKRALFLKNAANFLCGSKSKIFFRIADGRARFFSDADNGKYLEISGVEGSFEGRLFDTKTTRKIIKGIDSFRDGLVGKERVCYPSVIEDFPDLPRLGAVEGYVLPSDIEKVIHAAALDDVKPSFHAVCVDGEAIVTSDSRRLSFAPLSTGPKESALIPYALAKNAVGVVQISGRHCFSVCDHGSFSMRLVDGQFPNYKQVIPKEPGTVLIADVDFWREMKTITKAPFHKTKILETGTYIVDIDKDGKPFDRRVSDVSCSIPFGVNAEYCLEAVRPGSIIYVLDPMMPIVIKTGDVTDVVMPIQIKRED